ncbi:MAG: hypothetical protein V3S42_05455, partial [Candidatus Neomarinimicrobiota bacterium]
LVDKTIKKGLRLCKKRGQRLWLSLGYFEYAQILSHRSDKQKALEYLKRAIMMFTEMKMPGWLEQTRELDRSLN